ncbi:MAG: tetratricopeptide repeat protein [Bacteroidetes bacterium]|nr:MAG: tetratricopeptide repeat protein [Bacteroidota bacterium]
MKKITFVFLCLCVVLPAFAAKRFEWTPPARQAYQKVISLRFEEAYSDLARLKINDPDNLIAYHIENYIDFFRVYINEDETEFERLEKNKDRRLDIIAGGDRNSPYYLYIQADIRLHWALARLKFEEYATAFFEVNKAFKLLSKNVEKFPDFMPNKKDIGILHAMVGTIPDGYKWAVEWLSAMEGTIDQGRRELREVVEYARHHDFIYEEETYVLYAYLLLHLGNDKEAAWRIINTGKLNPKQSPMACFVMANLAMRTDRGSDAIRILENRPVGKKYFPFPYLDYMLGIAKLHRLDPDADQYLHRYLTRFSGRNFIKDAYQKLAWHSLLKGNRSDYDFYIKACKTKGYTIVGNDKSALKEAQTGLVPNVDLLKARLLFDGGYFDRAWQILNHKTVDDFQRPKDRLEYVYRLGRTAHKMKNYYAALRAYQATIDEGEDEPWYFACRAALEKGHIYEAEGNFTAAKEAFERCLEIDPDEYRTELHQQAKAGILRVSKFLE